MAVIAHRHQKENAAAEGGQTGLMGFHERLARRLKGHR